ncbi:hypothetical protein AAW12_05030 [Sphingobacterium sp. Ag1]|uniref:hypothetical protein n=1 Tax=Sphingobacterium sp. Ag1 TaxID=1643451 RepID=UPI00062810AC|nr:hypothetical protein [Sphingobacterium sp. Ag1]KKO92465.1 hypothetical protein AAW12_05030 [Sphingobacterium sp. Ag1]
MTKLILNCCNNIVLKHYPFFLLFIALFYAFTAVKSTGFHQPDEHFQIIEFANYKLGKTEATDLSWEYGAQIRPSLQPGIAYMTFSILDLLGLDDVFIKTLALRLLTSAIAITAIHLFGKSNKDLLNKNYYGFYIILSYLLWFIPYVSVRFSSESWSGIFLLFALYYLKVNPLKARSGFIFGLIIGFSVLFRYQSLLFAFGICLWLLLIQKSTWEPFIYITLGISTTLFFGFLLDFWFYGKPVVTIYNYFEANIIKDVASTFGVSPWYEYLWFIFSSPSFVIGFGISISVVFVLLKNKNDLILWTVVPFLVIHSIIPHKEMRFLFPLVFLCPYFLIYALQGFKSLNRLKANLLNIFVLLFLVANMMGLVVIGSKSAGNAKQRIGDFMHENYKSIPVHVIYIGAISPYNDWPFSRNTFFSYKNVDITNIYSIWNVDFEKIIKPNMDNLLMLSNEDVTGVKTLERLDALGFKLVDQTIPWYDQKIIYLYDPDNNDNIQIYKFVKKVN